MKKVTIIAEGGKNIGLGHIRRCLVIAQELRRKESEVLFLVNDDAAAIEWIQKEGFSYRTFSLTENNLSDIVLPHESLVLIDTKKEVSGLLRSLEKRGLKTVLMDNVSEARLEADCVIYPTAIYTNNLDWTGFKGKVFGGPEYVPIAKSFVEIREKAKQKKLQPPFHILVTMGGSDPNHLTYKVVSALMELWSPNPSPITRDSIHIKVVIGPSFSSDPDLDAIEKQSNSNIDFVRGKDDLSGLIDESHIAVTALGTTIFELACLGVPAVIIANYRSDEADMAAFKKLGIALPIGYYGQVSDIEIRQTITDLVFETGAWEKMSGAGKILIDGHGAERIAQIIYKKIPE